MKAKLITISLLITIINLVACTSNNDNALIPAKLGDKWGYIDQKGKWIIHPQFEGAGCFSENLASVRIAGKVGYIDKSGVWVINPQFDGAWNFDSDGLAIVSLKDKLGYINENGHYIVNPQFDDIEHYANIIFYY